jgi:glutathione S-transferase
MALKLYYHPLASYCWKPLIALYENATPFTPVLVDLGDEKSRKAFLEVWPMGEFPVLYDEARDRLMPQSSAIIEYLQLHISGQPTMIPEDPDAALEVRRWDHFLDSSVMEPMSKIVTDNLRPVDARDPFGVGEARATLASAYGVLEAHLLKAHRIDRSWIAGPGFSMADCSAAPSLYYADKVQPIGPSHPRLGAYLERLKQRPSFARVLEEAAPYFHLFPYKG